MFDWWQSANCLGVDTELFFTEEGSRSYPHIVKRLCQRCGVRKQCLQFAVDNDMVGYWGGTGELERKKLRRLKNSTVIAS